MSTFALNDSREGDLGQRKTLPSCEQRISPSRCYPREEEEHHNDATIAEKAAVCETHHTRLLREKDSIEVVPHATLPEKCSLTESTVARSPKRTASFEIAPARRPASSSATSAPLPMRYIEIPRHRFSSVCSLTASTSSCLNVCSTISEAPCSLNPAPPSPPALSSCQDDLRPAESSSPSHHTAGAISSASTTASVFRLEPRHRVAFGTHSLTRTSSGGAGGANHGRKRSAQTMSCTRRIMPSFGPLEGSDKGKCHPSVVSTPDEQDKPAKHERRLSSPMGYQQMDYAAFSMKGLSLHSPISNGGAANPLPSVCSPPNPPLGIPEGSVIDHPVATPTSFAGNSSCFSKVAASPSTDTIESSFRRYRSASMGSAADRGSATVAASFRPEFRASPAPELLSSPKIVPLTVLTHTNLALTPLTDSRIPPSSSASWLSSTAKNQRQEFLRHATGAAGMSSPFMRSLHSNSSPSTEGTGCPGSNSKASSFEPMEGAATPAANSTVRTPQHPPLSSVHLFYPDPALSSTSMISFAGSTRSVAGHPTTTATPVAQSKPRMATDDRSAWSRSTAPSSSTTKKQIFQVPKVTLTPRSTSSAGHGSTLPRFPSPTEDSKMASDASRHSQGTIPPLALPLRASARLTEDIMIADVVPHLLDVSLLSEPDLNESCSLDLSADAGSNYLPSSRGTAGSEFAPKPTLSESYIPFPSWGAYPPRQTSSAVPIHQPATTAYQESQKCSGMVDESVMMPTLQEFDSLPAVKQYATDGGRAKCSLFADDESLSDGEDDEKFLLAVPSAIAEESNLKASGNVLRQAKQPRLHFGSMTSMASNTSLFGVGFASSNTSLHGMVEQMQSSPSVSTGIFPANRGPSGVTHDHSSGSVGLDLDHAVPAMDRNGFEEANQNCPNGPSGRDLITPPVMPEAQSPPLLFNARLAPSNEVEPSDGDRDDDRFHDASKLSRKKALLAYDYSTQAVG